MAKPQGYDFDFIDQLPDDCICEICHLVLRQPVQTKCCGHRFCRDCLVEATKRKSECPIDRKPLNIQQDVFDDKLAERIVKSLRITCPRRSDGCQWQGELADVEVHEQMCDYMIVPCTFQRFGCDFKTQRKNMEEHLEKKIKDHLVLTSERISSLQEEKAFLSKVLSFSFLFFVFIFVFVLFCFHYETTQVFAEMKEQLVLTSEHLSSLENENKKLMTTLAEMEKQFVLTSERLSSLENENKKFKTTLAEMKEQLIPRTNKFIWKINNFAENFKKAKETGQKHFMYSDPFYTDRYGYKMGVKLYPNGDKEEATGHVSIFLQILRGEYDAVLPWPFARKTTITLLDQKENLRQRKNVEYTLSYKGMLDNPDSYRRPTTDSNTGHGYPKFISNEKLMTENYIVDDTIFVQVEVREEYT